MMKGKMSRITEGKGAAKVEKEMGRHNWQAKIESQRVTVETENTTQQSTPPDTVINKNH